MDGKMGRFAYGAGKATKHLILRWQKFSKTLDALQRIALIAGTLGTLWAGIDATTKALSGYFPTFDCGESLAVEIHNNGSPISCSFGFVGDVVVALGNNIGAFIKSFVTDLFVVSAIVIAILAIRWIASGKKIKQL